MNYCAHNRVVHERNESAGGTVYGETWRCDGCGAYFAPRPASKLPSAPSPAEETVWICANCGYGGAEHGMEGHPAHRCVADMRLVATRRAVPEPVSTGGAAEQCSHSYPLMSLQIEDKAWDHFCSKCGEFLYLDNENRGSVPYDDSVRAIAIRRVAAPIAPAAPCKHERTFSVTEAGMSDMRRCVDCGQTYSGRELARLNAIAPAAVSETPKATALLVDVMHLWVDGYISKDPDSCADDSVSGDVFEKIDAFLKSEGIAVDYCGWSQGAKPSAEGDGWIAVTERLPEMDGRWHLVYFDGYTRPDKKEQNGTMDTYTAQGQATWYAFTKYGWGITHWRPLPAPPSGQGEKR